MRLIQHLLFNRFYRVALYLLPLILLCYLFYTLFYKENLQTRNKEIPTLIKKEKKIELFDFALDLEKYIKSHGAIIKNLKINTKNIILQIECDLINSLKIVEFIENYSANIEIKKLIFKVISHQMIDLNLEIELKKVKRYYKNKKLIQITNNVLYEESKAKTKDINIKEATIKIDAIVNEQVLINNIWYKVGSILNNQKIISIKSDYIVLENKGEIKNIRMYENEYIR